MVLEHLFPENWLENRIRYAIIVSFVYTIISIFSSKLIFGSNSGIVSVVFISILLTPYLAKLTKREEIREKKETSFSLRNLYKDNKNAFHVYFSMFITIYLTYALVSFFLPSFGISQNTYFAEQLHPEVSFKGQTDFSAATFTDIMKNNFWVTLACFLIALVAGDAASFFVIWNASSWGAIFGYRAYLSGMYTATSGIVNLFTIIALTFPHFFIETFAYIFSAISGTVISDDILEKGKKLRNFVAYLIVFGLLYFIIYTKFLSLLPISKIMLLAVNIVLTTSIIYCISFFFKDAGHKEVFVYNYYLFLIAIVFVILGAFIETLVLNNSDLLMKIYSAAFMMK